MKQVNIHDAKTHFSKLVDAAAAGEDIVIAKARRPAARLVAYVEKEPSIRLGLLHGQIGIAADFDAPMRLLTADGELSAYSELVTKI